MVCGEEFVTTLVSYSAIQVLASSNFLPEALGFIVLAVASHLVGNVAEANLHAFHSRPGASAGVFLGSITWPLVFAFRLQSVSGRLFFWSAVLSSFRVLSLIFWTATKNCKPSFATKLESSSGKAFCFCVCVLLAWLTGFQDAVLLPFQAFASGLLLSKIFRRFPESATVGEASMVAIGLPIYLGNIVSSALSGNGVAGSDVVTQLLQVAVVGLGCLPWIYQAFLHLTRQMKLVSLVASIVLTVAVLVPACFWLVTGLDQHPVLWVVDFMLEKPVQTFGLSAYWLCSLCIVPFLYYVAKRNRIPHILLRKAYHLLAVTMFIPALLIHAQFLHLAFTVAFAVFSITEMIRIWNVPVLGPKVNDFMCAFADSRDSDKLIVSHFSLLLGCALPVWLHAHSIALNPLASFAGILSIGIGDTMASFVGYNYGSWRLGKTNKKTVEGTTAGILSLAFACYLVQFFLPGCFGLSRLLMASVFSGMVEAYTTQLDNAFVPLVFYAFLCI